MHACFVSTEIQNLGAIVIQLFIFWKNSVFIVWTFMKILASHSFTFQCLDCHSIDLNNDFIDKAKTFTV